MAELLEQIKQLTPAAQLALIREITLNLEHLEEDDDEDELTEEQKEQLRESSRAANLNPFEGSDWPTVRARLFPSFSL